MSDFSASFLNEDWPGGTGPAPAFLGAFGKHPGWNDHMDEVGLATHSLALFRRSLYGSGIATQIERGAWSDPLEDRILPEFDHLLYWSRLGESIISRVWSSKDGKGRHLYPMVLATHLVGIGFDSAARDVIPLMEKAALACRAAKDPASVIERVETTQVNLRERLVAESNERGSSALGVEALCRFLFGNQTLLFRLFHHLIANLAFLGPHQQASKRADEKVNRSAHLRLPTIPGASLADSLNGWTEFFSTQLGAALPILALLPVKESWVDFIIGEPLAEDFFGLRAKPKAEPLVTSIPYQWEPALQEQLSPVLKQIESERLPDYSVLDDTPVLSNRKAARRWLARQRPSGRGLLNRIFS